MILHKYVGNIWDRLMQPESGGSKYWIIVLLEKVREKENDLYIFKGYPWHEMQRELKEEKLW